MTHGASCLAVARNYCIVSESGLQMPLLGLGLCIASLLHCDSGVWFLSNGILEHSFFPNHSSNQFNIQFTNIDSRRRDHRHCDLFYSTPIAANLDDHYVAFVCMSSTIQFYIIPFGHCLNGTLDGVWCFVHGNCLLARFLSGYFLLCCLFCVSILFPLSHHFSFWAHTLRSIVT